MEGPRGSNGLVNGASRRVDPGHVIVRDIATEEITPDETAADEIVADEIVADEIVADEVEPPAKKKRPRRRLVILAVVVLVLIAAGLGGWYLAYSSQFVSTDNAQVDGDKVAINAPGSGTLTGWVITEGTQVHTDQVVGRIQILGTGPQRTIKSPGNGTVAVNDAVEGQYVTAGTELATAYNFNDIYVTARVDETDIKGVHLGALVDIDVDSYPGSPVTGTVEEIQDSAATTFNPFPEDNTTGNFQKVSQVIPVKIALTNTAGLSLAPGMNVTVHIHKS
jgi:multidrug resistance efflux pump